MFHHSLVQWVLNRLLAGETSHVETVALLCHKSPDSHINVTIEFGEGEGKVPPDKIVERAK